MAFPDPLMTKADVAQLLRCCERTVERQVKLNAFPPPQRFGKESLWFQSIVFGWLEKRRQEQQQWVAADVALSPSAPSAPTVSQDQAAVAAPHEVKKPRASRAKRRASERPSASFFTPEQLASIGRSVDID